MGTKRVGLARMQALIENLKREINIGASLLSGIVTQGDKNTAIGLGCKKVQAFAGSLAGTDTAAAYGTNDILCYLGALDVTTPAGLNDPSKILIDKITFVVETVAGPTLVGNLALGTVANEATNEAVTGRVEIMGAGAAQVSPEGYGLATTATPADIDYDNATLTFCRPNITVAGNVVHLYACTHTALDGDATAGRFNVLVEYTVL